MVIQIDDKEGAIGIRVRDFENKKGDYQKGYKQYHYCSKETKEKMIQLLESALDRVKYGPRLNKIK
jgi:hypothetical protein